jgi:hypothetical protein
MSTSTWRTGNPDDLAESASDCRGIAEDLPGIGIKEVEKYGAQIYRILNEARG